MTVELGHRQYRYDCIDCCLLGYFMVFAMSGCTTTYAISAYHHSSCEFESRSGRGVQHYVIKFVSDL